MFVSDIGWPNDLALDPKTQLLYWCDAKLDRIEVSSTSGSNRRVVVSNTLPHPFGLTLFGEYMYWTDWDENVVQRAKKDTGEEREIILG